MGTTDKLRRLREWLVNAEPHDHTFRDMAVAEADRLLAEPEPEPSKAAAEWRARMAECLLRLHNAMSDDARVGALNLCGEIADEAVRNWGVPEHLANTLEGAATKLAAAVKERDELRAERESINVTLDERNAEVVRLRQFVQAMGLVSTIKGDMQVNIDDPMAMAREVCEDVERLRAGSDVRGTVNQKQVDALLQTNDDLNREILRRDAKPAPKVVAAGIDSNDDYWMVTADGRWWFYHTSRREWHMASRVPPLPTEPQPDGGGK